MSRENNLDDHSQSEEEEEDEGCRAVEGDVLDILAEIQRLHRITSRDGDLNNKQELREGHQDERSRHHQRLRRRRGRSETDTPVVRRNQRTAASPPNSLISNCSLNRVSFLFGFSIIVIICAGTPLVNKVFEHLQGMRCFLPNNYMIWEATRPRSDCNFCRGIDQPIILSNLSRSEFAVSCSIDPAYHLTGCTEDELILHRLLTAFSYQSTQPYAYSSAPIIIKKAVSHWPAVTLLNYTYLKNLYLRTPGALESVDEDCQFLHFKSNFMTLRQVFEMPDARAEMKPGEMPWYVGWSNCHAGVLAELRKLYPRPHFLPSDAEMPNTDFIFLGWEQGAVMHLDYIPRLMWQAQLRGRKHWLLAPTPECDSQCKSFAFFVEAGDAILVDTRLWYHGTHVTNGEFSLTIQSEYG